MSENNGSAEKKAPTGGGKAKIDRAAFYKVLKAFEECQSEFVSTRPTTDDVVEKLSGMVGFPVPKTTVEQIKKMTGISWTPHKPSLKQKRKKHVENSRDNERILCRALRQLYAKLKDLVGEEPEALKQLMEVLDARKRKQEAQKEEVDANLPSQK